MLLLLLNLLLALLGLCVLLLRIHSLLMIHLLLLDGGEDVMRLEELGVVRADALVLHLLELLKWVLVNKLFDVTVVFKFLGAVMKDQTEAMFR